MANLLEPAGVTTANCLAPGFTLFRRYLDDAAQHALAGEIAQAVLQAPWFLPRSGKAVLGQDDQLRLPRMGVRPLWRLSLSGDASV